MGTTLSVPARFVKPSGAPLAVEVVELAKRYPKRPVDAVSGLSFSVPVAEVFGLLGPNGAGKTTTIGILTTRVRPSAGKALVAGVDVVATPARARALLGVVPQRNNLDRSISIRQNLTFHASYHRVPKRTRDDRADELLRRFGLHERGDHRPDYVSGGQAQRIMIARALMHQPQVLFLDEPSTGLDPAARHFVWERVAELRKTGTTVLLTTHDMDEAAALCDRVGIIDHGRLIALGSPRELISEVAGHQTLDIQIALGGTRPSRAEVSRAIRAIPEILGLEDTDVAPIQPATVRAGSRQGLQNVGAPNAGILNLRVGVAGAAAAAVAPVTAVVASIGASITGLSILEPTLEDVFLHLTGRALR